MKLFPLIDRTGTIRFWADRRTGWISDIVALISFDGVFRAKAIAEQIGWFEGNHIRNRRGQVVLIQPNAKLDGVIMPRAKKISKPPQLHLPIGCPLLKWLLPPPMKPRAFADFESLFDDGLAQIRAFEEQLQRLANRPHRFSEKRARKRTA